MKKTIISIAIIILSLVGCGGGGSSSPASESSTTSAVNAIPAGGDVNAPANTQ